MALSSKSKRKKKKGLSSSGISSLYVRGFKSLFEGSSIEVRPLTILAGANSSGKSSIMQPLLMMKQTLEATYDPGALLIDGPHVRFTSVEQFLSKRDRKPVDEFEIGLDIKGEKGIHSVSEIFRKDAKKGIEIVEARYKSEDLSVSLRPEMTREDIISAAPYCRALLKSFKRDDIERGFELRVKPMRCFLEAGLSIVEKYKTDSTFFAPSDSTFFAPFIFNSELFESHIRRLIHVPALRGNPERTYKTTAIGTKFSGTFENYVASVINHWQVSKDPRLRELGRLLEMLGLTWKVHTKQVDDTRVELRV
ncbi:MAG: AAA family ATPase, partial [Euryarchaeota archaeon]|nr:AAA family ATPase [Euryarchaeota archaeon]